MALVLFFSSVGVIAQSSNKAKGYYQVIIYNFATAEQQKTINNFLEKAYLPALHNQKISNIGVFAPIANDTVANKQLYVIFPLKSFEQAATLAAKVSMDAQYLANGKEYLDAPYNNPPYKRMESILLQQFPMARFFTLPKLKNSNEDKIYELRSYESANEKIFANKVEMFNEGEEIKIFDKLDFNPVFYASVIAGSHMPNLLYLTSFENMNDRDEHWKKFGADADWKRLSTMPKYQNNVSKADIILMKAMNYSEY